MDVCAFVGVAPRGPARRPYTDEELFASDRFGPGEIATYLDASPVARPRRRSVAVPVDSWDEYVRLYGRFEGPGRLPYAVASFFEQGGRRAFIVRIVPDYPHSEERTRGAAVGRLRGFTVNGLKQQLLLRARNEGTWGNGLSARLSYSTRALTLETPAVDAVVVSWGAAPVAGTLLRFRLSAGTPELRLVAEVERVRDPSQARYHARLVLDRTLPGVPVSAEIVEGTLEVDDGDGRRETHQGLAFGSAHRRRIGSVLCEESELVYPSRRWADADIVPASPLLHDVFARRFHHGVDPYDDLTHEDFFDSSWVLRDLVPSDGVYALLDPDAEDVATVVVPDLYEPLPLPPFEDVLEPQTAGPNFAQCVDLGPGEQAKPAVDLPGLVLDPNDPAELDQIVDLQHRLVELATATRAFVALLDVPPGLDQRRILRWRAEFDSSYAAAYCPWLDVVRNDERGLTKMRTNPSAFAAGVLADREIRFGVPFGPSNELAVGVIDVSDAISPARHAELHPLGVNVFLRERDGVLLTAARTLSSDPQYRQLSVRRLMMMLVRTLERELQWVVFEPNNLSLQADLRHILRSYLGRLYRANAFVGATEDEAFFVKCDEALNDQTVLDAGQLIAEIGVAPAEPLEFIVVQLLHDGDGTLLVAETVR
jgi:hypothetical protein